MLQGVSGASQGALQRRFCGSPWIPGYFNELRGSQRRSRRSKGVLESPRWFSRVTWRSQKHGAAHGVSGDLRGVLEDFVRSQGIQGNQGVQGLWGTSRDLRGVPGVSGCFTGCLEVLGMLQEVSVHFQGVPGGLTGVSETF